MVEDWEKEELMDQISAHVEEWLILADGGKMTATGVYDDGELIEVREIEHVSQKPTCLYCGSDISVGNETGVTMCHGSCNYNS